MTDWTPPTHVVTGTTLDSAKHNAEVVDNLAHLHGAKVTRLAHWAALTIPHNTATGIAWTTRAHDTMDSWSLVPNPERIYPNPAGFYRVSTQFQFPGSVATGVRQVIVRKITTADNVEVVLATSANSTNSTSVSAACIVEMNGTTDYLYIECKQTSGDEVVTAGVKNTFIDLEWIGA